MSAPSDVLLQSPVSSGRQVNLSWQSSIDPESFIANYQIYRGITSDAKVLIRTVKGKEIYSDTVPLEQTLYYYRVKAMNGEGLLSSQFSNEVSILAGDDVTGPLLADVYTVKGDGKRVWIRFNEPVQKQSAELSQNYEISPAIFITKALLLNDEKTVELQTSALLNGLYTIKVNQILDKASIPNVITSNSEKDFSFKSFIAARWTFDEGQGQKIFDSSGNGLTGDITGATWIEGKSGKALSFNGDSNFVLVPYSNHLNTDLVSVSVWFRLPDEQYKTMDLVNFGKAVNDKQSNYKIIIGSKGDIGFQISDESTWGIANRKDPIPSGEWQHIVASADGQDLKIYWNGKLAATAAQPFPFTFAKKYNFFIGTANEKYHYFKGDIDDITIFDKALDSAEVRKLYEEGLLDPEPVPTNTLEKSTNFSLSTFPNPFNPAINLKISGLSSFESIFIYSIDGKRVADLGHKFKENSFKWKPKGLRSGLYLIEVKSNKGLWRKPIILLK